MNANVFFYARLETVVHWPYLGGASGEAAGGPGYGGGAEVLPRGKGYMFGWPSAAL